MFAGFIFLVLIAQLSAYVLGQAILAYQPAGSADLTRVQGISVILALSAGTLGVAFGSAVLMITRKRLAAEVDVYRATGLPLSSAVRLMLSYHPIRPLVWLAVAVTIAFLGDSFFRLDVLIPLGLATVFAILLLGWVVTLTGYMFSRRGFREERGRVG